MHVQSSYKNIRKRCETCLKLTIKTPERLLVVTLLKQYLVFNLLMSGVHQKVKLAAVCMIFQWTSNVKGFVRSNRLEVLCKKWILKNFAKLTVPGLIEKVTQKLRSQACNFIEKVSQTPGFSCQFCEIFTKTFFYYTTSWFVFIWFSV